MTTGRIFVCVTCDRYTQPACTPSRGGLLAQALKAEAAARRSPLVVRSVECLNGCPRPCTAALRAPGKAVIRFAGLVPADTCALIDAATCFAASPNGEISLDAMHATLRKKLIAKISLQHIARD